MRDGQRVAVRRQRLDDAGGARVAGVHVGHVAGVGIGMAVRGTVRLLRVHGRGEDDERRGERAGGGKGKGLHRAGSPSVGVASVRASGSRARARAARVPPTRMA